MGRKKIEMKMVEDKKSRQVTFCKRKNGLFKKANELVTLCAVQVAIVVFSPSGKPFSFGHPSVDCVSQRFIDQDSNKPSQHVAADPHHDRDQPKQQEASDGGNGLEDVNQQLSDLLQQLEIEKKRGKELDRALKEQAAACKYNLDKLNQIQKGRAIKMEASSSLLLPKDAQKDADN